MVRWPGVFWFLVAGVGLGPRDFFAVNWSRGYSLRVSSSPSKAFTTSALSRGDIRKHRPSRQVLTSKAPSSASSRKSDSRSMSPPLRRNISNWISCLNPPISLMASSWPSGSKVSDNLERVPTPTGPWDVDSLPCSDGARLSRDIYLLTVETFTFACFATSA